MLKPKKFMCSVSCRSTPHRLFFSFLMDYLRDNEISSADTALVLLDWTERWVDNNCTLFAKEEDNHENY